MKYYIVKFCKEKNEEILKIFIFILTDAAPAVQEDVASVIKSFIDEYQSQHRVTILDLELEANTIVEAGRNCTSGLMRLNLSLMKNDRKFPSSVVLKVPQLSNSYETLAWLGLYKREMFMYKVVLPRMHQFWPGPKLYPNFYVASPTGSLVLENLQESEYLPRQKFSSFELAECKTVLKTLAQFHALSVKYMGTYGAEECHSINTFTGHGAGIMAKFAPLIDKIGRNVSPALSKSELSKWMHFEANCATIINEVYTTYNADEFFVICHGDLQYNNIFLKKDGCKLIDFQCYHVGSPVLDLIKFLVLGIRFELFQQHRDAIFDHYLRSLNATMEELGCTETYTLNQLNADFFENRFFLIFALCSLSILWAGMSSWSDERENALDNVMKSERYISLFKNWLKVVE